MIAALALAACVKARLPEPPPAPPLARLMAQVSLSVDVDTGRASLTVHGLMPEPRPLPQERNGVPMDTCLLVEPVRATADMVLAPRRVTARCDGAALTLIEQLPGIYRHDFAAPPAAGTACEVEVDGRRLALPPLPPAPDPALRGASLTWTPAGADELRYVIPQRGGVNLICRLADDGEAPAPRGARLQPAFFTRHALALHEGEGGAVAVTVTSGVWVEPEAL